MSDTLNIPVVSFSLTIFNHNIFNRGIEIMRLIEMTDVFYITTEFNENKFTFNCADEDGANALIKLLQMNEDLLKRNGCRITSFRKRNRMLTFTKDDAMKMMLAVLMHKENSTNSLFVPN